MGFLNTILEILFPSKCILCGKKGSDLCLLCLSTSQLAERETVNWIFPIYDYRHPIIKKSLWLLKYSGKKRLAGVFAEVLYEKILEELSDLIVLENFTEPLLIPIPLSPERYKERGFNQAELICQELVKINKSRQKNNNDLNFYFEKKVLIKPKETEHQARLRDRKIRLKNLSGSFALGSNAEKAKLIKNRNVILIDDITTTGATLNEARKILKQAGGRKIIAFTVAH